MPTKLIAINDFVLVKKITVTETENDFVVENEAKGDGIIFRCELQSPIPEHNLEVGRIVHVPEYAIRQLNEEIFACSKESIICYEQI